MTTINLTSKEKIYVYSDFHIGGHSGLNFQLDEAKFIDYLTTKTKDGYVVINGDLVDLYETDVCCDSQIAKYQRTKDSWTKLFAFFETNPKVKLVVGNHDDLGSNDANFKNLNMLASLQINYLNDEKESKVVKKILFEHGHQYDASLKGQCCCRLSCCPKGYRCFGSFLSCLFPCLISYCTPFEGPFGNDDDLAGIAETLLHNKYKEIDALIMGHTHLRMVKVFNIENQRKYYVNTGTTANSKYSFDETVIALENDKLEIKQQSASLT